MFWARSLVKCVKPGTLKDTNMKLGLKLKKRAEEKSMIIRNAGFLENHAGYAILALEIMAGSGGSAANNCHYLVLNMRSHILSWQIKEMWWAIMALAISLNTVLVYHHPNTYFIIASVTFWVCLFFSWIENRKKFKSAVVDDDFVKLAKALELIDEMRGFGIKLSTKTELTQRFNRQLCLYASEIMTNPDDEKTVNLFRTGIKRVINLGIDCGLLVQTTEPEIAKKHTAEHYYKLAFDSAKSDLAEKSREVKLPT